MTMDRLRLARAILAAVLLFGFQTGIALAHASLNASSPQDGAVVQSAPATLSLTFSEPVSPLTLNLIGPDGAATGLDGFEIKSNVVDIAAPSDLQRGTHVLAWRVVSADGHPIGGSVVFSIGEVSTIAPVVVEHIDRPVRTGLWLSRVALYCGLFIGVGGVFARSALMPGVMAGRTTIVFVLAIGLAGAVLSLGFQGLDALGAPIARIVDPLIWSTGFGTSYGATAITASASLIVALFAQATRATPARALAIAALIMAASALALSGHASAASPQWLMRPAVFLHALAIAVWVGALVPLGLSLRRREAAALPGLARFSRAMPTVLAVLVAAGVALAIVQVGRLGALLDTAYGQVFLAKLLLLGGLFALAAVNRWTLTAAVEAGDRSATRRLVRSIAAETLIVLALLAAVAVWRFTPPPRALDAAAAQPATIHIHTAKAMADVAITPGRAGPATISATIMTGDFGPLDAKEVTFVFTHAAAGIEAFERRAEKHGDGTWRAEGVVLPLSGRWTLRIDILINDFEMASITGEIDIRP
jgi:copper transport protein